MLCSECCDYRVILSVASIAETDQHCYCVRFGMNRLYPQVSRAVIYEGIIIVGFAEEGFTEFSGKVGVN